MRIVAANSGSAILDESFTPQRIVATISIGRPYSDLMRDLHEDCFYTGVVDEGVMDAAFKKAEDLIRIEELEARECMRNSSRTAEWASAGTSRSPKGSPMYRLETEYVGATSDSTVASTFFPSCPEEARSQFFQLLHTVSRQLSPRR